MPAKRPCTDKCGTTKGLVESRRQPNIWRQAFPTFQTWTYTPSGTSNSTDFPNAPAPKIDFTTLIEQLPKTSCNVVLPEIISVTFQWQDNRPFDSAGSSLAQDWSFFAAVVTDEAQFLIDQASASGIVNAISKGYYLQGCNYCTDYINLTAGAIMLLITLTWLKVVLRTC